MNRAVLVAISIFLVISPGPSVTPDPSGTSPTSEPVITSTHDTSPTSMSSAIA